MNDNITNYLNFYLQDPNPQYAVLLDGPWGCGKTCFVDSWLKGLESDESAVLKPIKVSLFGMNKISQINDAINRELFPILNNKGYKIGKTVLSMVGKAMLKCNLDVNDDGKSDGTLEIQIDPLMSLFSNADEKMGCRFIIFDDIERCNIDLRTLFGYINDFVENRLVHVVVICNCNEIREQDRVVFDKFKEKVIGRTFVVKPDITSAMNRFLNEVPFNDFTKQQASVISRVFEATGYNNLRVLRQAIRNYNRIIENQPIDTNNKYHCYCYRNFLIRYLVVMTELAKGNESLIRNMCLIPAFGKRLPENIQDEVSSLRAKYDIIRSEYSINVFDPRHLDALIGNIKEDTLLDEYLYWQIKDQEMPSWKKLEAYLELSNEEFVQLYGEVENVFYTANHEDIRVDTKIGIIYMFLNFEAIGIKAVSEDFYSSSLEYIQFLINKVHNNTDFNTLRNIISKQSRYFSEETIGEDERRKTFRNKIDEMFQKRGEELFKSAIQLLEDLNCDNISRLESLLDEKKPDSNKAYREIPFFQYADSNKMATSILVADNKARIAFHTFLDHRYGFSTSHALSEGLEEEYDCLYVMNQELIKGTEDKTLIDKRLITMITEAITRILKLMRPEAH